MPITRLGTPRGLEQEMFTSQIKASNRVLSIDELPRFGQTRRRFAHVPVHTA